MDLDETQISELKEALYELDTEDVNIYEDYSGRSMFGATTTGFTVDGGPAQVMVLGIALHKIGIDPIDFPQRQDQLGLQTIIY